MSSTNPPSSYKLWETFCREHPEWAHAANTAFSNKLATRYLQHNVGEALLAAYERGLRGEAPPSLPEQEKAPEAPIQRRRTRPVPAEQPAAIPARRRRATYYG